MTDRPTYKAIVASIVGMAPIVVDGREYSGDYLASIVAMNPNDLQTESAATPQIIAELGRLVAAAKRIKDRAELTYRIWRDSQVHKLTNDVEAARVAGFEVACDPGVDAKGKPKLPRCPSVEATERYLRTRPEYLQWNEAVILADEAWTALHAAHEAAQARTWAIQSRGGDAPVARTAAQLVEQNPPYEPPTNPFPPGYVPPPPRSVGDNPPSAPGVADEQRRIPPPPPPIPR